MMMNDKTINHGDTETRKKTKSFLRLALCLERVGRAYLPDTGRVENAPSLDGTSPCRASMPDLRCVSAVVTVIACLIPVRRAVDIEPALVLRGE
jgi:hypothetical protein